MHYIIQVEIDRVRKADSNKGRNVNNTDETPLNPLLLKNVYTIYNSHKA